MSDIFEDAAAWAREADSAAHSVANVTARPPAATAKTARPAWRSAEEVFGEEGNWAHRAKAAKAAPSDGNIFDAAAAWAETPSPVSLPAKPVQVSPVEVPVGVPGKSVAPPSHSQWQPAEVPAKAPPAKKVATPELHSVEPAKLKKVDLHELSVPEHEKEPQEYPDLHYRDEWKAKAPRTAGRSQNPKMITVHCSDTPTTDSAGMPKRLRAIQHYHRDVSTRRKKQWRDIGYHYLIDSDGGVWQGTPHLTRGTHTGGRNLNNVGICLIGRFAKEDEPPTGAQWSSVVSVIQWLCQTYDIALDVEHIYGHRDFANKECPGHHAYEKLKGLRGDG